MTTVINDTSPCGQKWDWLLKQHRQLYCRSVIAPGFGIGIGLFFFQFCFPFFNFFFRPVGGCEKACGVPYIYLGRLCLLFQLRCPNIYYAYTGTLDWQAEWASCASDQSADRKQHSEVSFVTFSSYCIAIR